MFVLVRLVSTQFRDGGVLVPNTWGTQKKESKERSLWSFFFPEPTREENARVYRNIHLLT